MILHRVQGKPDFAMLRDVARQMILIYILLYYLIYIIQKQVTIATK